MSCLFKKEKTIFIIDSAKLYCDFLFSILYGNFFIIFYLKIYNYKNYRELAQILKLKLQSYKYSFLWYILIMEIQIIESY